MHKVPNTCLDVLPCTCMVKQMSLCWCLALFHTKPRSNTPECQLGERHQLPIWTKIHTLLHRYIVGGCLNGIIRAEVGICPGMHICVQLHALNWLNHVDTVQLSYCLQALMGFATVAKTVRWNWQGKGKGKGKAKGPICSAKGSGCGLTALVRKPSKWFLACRSWHLGSMT